MAVSRLLVLLLLCAPLALHAQSGPGYFRDPAVHGDTVVFVAEGDLWTVSRSGGAARRLTTHPAEESRPAISPDGRWLAFSAAYEGPLEAHIMPLAGGSPTRVSFENSQALVLGWTAQGEVLYSSLHTGGVTGMRVVVAVDPTSLKRRTLPLADANDAVLDPDGRWLYFIRFGLTVTNDNARGYRGGALGQLWRFDLSEGREAERIGPRDANLRRPMWWNGRLLVLSDQDSGGRFNLWTLGLDGSDARALTSHRDFDIRSAQAHEGRVVYQHGADLRLLDLASGDDRKLEARLVSDFDQRRVRWLDDPLRYLESSSFAPSGDRIVVNARGRATLAGLGALRRVEIAAPEGSRISSPVISPDGRHVYAICDASGEQEIWRFATDGSPGGQALTSDGDSRRWNLWLAPDGRHLAHDDKRGRLWLLDINSGRNRLIDDGGVDGNEGYDGLAWSPDSTHLAFVRQGREVSRSRIALFDLGNERMHWLTSDRYGAYSPSFSPDGRWLWFLSEREFRLANGSPWGDRNTGPFFDQRTRIYALALQTDQRFPFQPEDELSLAKLRAQPADDNGKNGDNGTGSATLPTIEHEGLAERVYEVPLPAGNFRNLQATKDRLYYLDGRGRGTSLKYLPIGNKEEQPTQVESGVVDYGLSTDGKRLYLRQTGSGDNPVDRFLIADTATKLPDDRSRATVQLDDWSLRIDPPVEWRQMFGDAWRMHRDHFYDNALRGVDWTATRAQFEPLLARVSDRRELDDLLAQMMNELGALHSQVRGGEFRRADDGAQAASLGARLEPVANGVRVTGILRGPPELPSERSPLQSPGSDVRIGDVITAINGQPTHGLRDVSDLLRNQAGQQVLLDIRRDGDSHQTVVVAIGSQTEDRLRYTDWVEASRERVEQASDGRIGYLHLYAMGPNDMAGFVREFYAQFDREALIVDVRRNRGGNIDSWVIEKLLRRAWAFWQRPDGQPYTNMQQAFRGHLVVLTDALTYSDGETFAAGIKALELAPLIGTRSAGAGIWLSARNTLVDRGLARVSEFPQFGMDGEWLIEARGVDPDVVVDNLPHATWNGDDAQLRAGIDWLQRKLETEPVPALRPRAIPPLPHAHRSGGGGGGGAQP